MKKKRGKGTFLVVVTFDLPGGRNNTGAYGRIKKRFAEMQLEKFIQSKRMRGPRDLPQNTYIAKYPGRIAKKASMKLCKYIREQAKRIILEEHHSAYIFVVGRKWAWSRGAFGER